MIPSAYVHIPFCEHICTYCAFSRTARLDWIDPWLVQIKQEIKTALKKARKDDPAFALQTIYFGGGTPSILSAGQLQELMDCFQGYLAKDYEWTMEANPESLTQEKLQVFLHAGVNRLSIGIQTFDESRLARLGRHHSAKKALECIALAKQAGFSNLSVDLMYGFYDQTPEQLQADLDAFLKLDVSHLSIYSLILEPDSLLAKRGEPELDEQKSGELFEWIESRLQQAGYTHYEISSYAKDKQYGLHNTLIWQDGLYYGFGYGAVGRDEQGLYHHSGSLKNYIEGKSEIEYENDANPWFDAIMTGLRTIFGLDLEAWNTKYQSNFVTRYPKTLVKYQDHLTIDAGCLKADGKGMEILDSILVDFLIEDENQSPLNSSLSRTSLQTGFQAADLAMKPNQNKKSRTDSRK